MQYARKPAWRYYPQPDRPRHHLRQFIAGMDAIGTWLKNDWWQRAKTDTKSITKALEPHLPTPGASVESRRNLGLGWNLETREKFPTIPFLYDEGDKSLQSVQPDAIFVDDQARLTLVEIEGGGALQNYRGMKDIVEALLLPPVDYVALVVPFKAHGNRPYDYYNNLVSSLYAQQVVQPHLRGLLVIGY
jgi:hypothetical protein